MYFNRLAKGFSSLLSFQTCQKFSGVRRIAPFYHTVSDDILPHIEPLYNVRTVDQFKKDLIELRSHYEFVDAAELKAAIESKSSKKLAFLSFDDGLKQCHSIIRPILKELSIHAGFFINRDFVNGSDVFYRYKVGFLISALQNEALDSSLKHDWITNLKEKKLFHSDLDFSLNQLKFKDGKIINDMIRSLNITGWEKDIYMNENEIQDLINDGFNIGGHSLNHAEFSNLNTSERLAQIKESVDYCQEKYSEPMRLFAFPFFDYNLDLTIFKSMYEELNIDMSFGTSGLKRDFYDKSIQRMDMEGNSGSARTFLKSELFTQGVRRMLGKDQMKRLS